MARKGKSYAELVAEAKARGASKEEIQAIERAMNRARGRVSDYKTAQALGAVGGPKIAGGKAFTVTSQYNNIFDIAQAVYGDERYAEQLLRANPWLLDSQGNVKTLYAGMTLNTDVLETGLGSGLAVSSDFMGAALGGEAAYGYGAGGMGAAASYSTAGQGGTPVFNPNYGGVTTPQTLTGQPLIGDTVLNPGGGNVLQTGSAAASFSNQNFQSGIGPLQGEQYSLTPPDPNNPLGTGGTPAPTLPQAPPSYGAISGPSAVRTAQQTYQSFAQARFGSSGEAKSLTDMAVADPFENMSPQDIANTLITSGLAISGDTPDYTSGGYPTLLTARESNAYVSITDQWLQNLRFRREMAGKRRKPRGAAFSPFNSPFQQGVGGGIIDRSLNWRIGIG